MRHQGLDVLDALRFGQLGEDVAQIGVGLDAVGLGGAHRPPNYAEQFWSDALC